jgi:hypothetical protein
VALDDETTLDTIKDLKTAEPFTPFRIVMSSGDKYLIDNPHGLAVGETQLFYYPTRSDRGVHLRINQITAIEQFQETK